jgi:hypothetical protein
MRMFSRLAPLRSLVVVGAALLAPTAGASQGPADANESGPSWPIEVVLDERLVVIYQPQPETFEGNLLAGRFALSAQPEDGSGEPIFGTAWFEARVDTNRDERTATVRDIEIIRLHFPDITSEQASEGAALLTGWLAGQELQTSMDELLTSLEVAERRNLAVEGLKMDPPEIHYRDRPAVLVVIDGEPILERINDDGVMAVVNSAYAILFDPGQTRYYLFAGEDLWYGSSAVKGPWEFTDVVPARIKGIIPPMDDEIREQLATAPESMTQDPGSPPEIVVVTAPSELIATVGPAQFTPISDTELMFVGNTESDLLFHTPTQDFYVLLSGRWFRSKELAGPWDWVSSEDLPETFQAIPTDSDMGSIRAHVAGTEEAADAVLDAQIPQTAAIRLDDQSLEVEYDGEPQWEAIEGTSLQYAVNTATPVILATQRYYAVSDGVWYTAGQPAGPWRVATAVPEEIYSIPPSSPMYHVTYVEIYQSTPEYVYVGYTPGYTGTYVHNTTVVYGTGWYYPPWWGAYYYPRYTTWGWHMRWNPWTGWNVGFTWSNGWFTFGIGYSPWRPWCCYGGWWGPRPIVPYPYYASRRAAYRAGYRAGFRAGYRAGHANIYNSPRVANRRATPAQLDRARPAVPANRPQARPSTRPNNVLADRDGNIHRRSDQGWQNRNPGGGWSPPTAQPSRPQVRPSQPGARPGQPTTRPTQPQTRPSQPVRPSQPQARPVQPRPSQPQARPVQPQTRQQELTRSQQQRARGATRSQQFQQSRPAGRPSGGVPRRRGGEDAPLEAASWLLAVAWAPGRRRPWG